MEKPLVEKQPQPQPDPQPREPATQHPLSTSLSIKRKPVASHAQTGAAAATTTATTTTPSAATPPLPPPAAVTAPIRDIRDLEKRPQITTTTITTTQPLSKSITESSFSSTSSTTSIPTTEKELATYTSNHHHGSNHIHKSKHDAPLPPLPVSTHHHNNNDTKFSSPTQLLHRPYRRRDNVVAKFKSKILALPKRTRYLVLGAFAALVVLIIGLAAGLSAGSNRFKNLPLPDGHGGPVTGDLTYYEPGLGACGVTSTSSDFIVALSHRLFDAVQRGSNVNANPLCGKKIRARRGQTSVDLTVVDRCTGCQPQDIDVTTTVFKGLADIDQGRVRVTWAWLEDVPSGVTES